MSKKKYKITNWSQYNNALKSRGSLTFWVAEKLDSQWYDINTDKKWGKSNKYSDFSIKLMVTLRLLFKLPLRQLEGFVVRWI